MVAHDHAPLGDILEGLWALMDRHPAIGNVNEALGVIQADGSLVVDGFSQHPYPIGAYWWDERFSLPDPMSTTLPAAVGDHGTHTHDVPRPAALTPPLLGLEWRVTVKFVNANRPGGQGVDPVVTGIVVRRAA